MSRLHSDQIYKTEPYLIAKEFRRRPLQPREIEIASETYADNEERLTKIKEEGMPNKMWVSLIDERTCDGCQELNGMIVPVDQYFKSERRGVIVLIPALHPSCRCRIIGAV